MKARDIMEKNFVTIAPQASVLEAVHIMMEHKVSSLPVVNGAGAVLGMVSEGDLLRKKIAPKAPQVVNALGRYEGIEEYREAFRKMGANTTGEIMTAPAIMVQAEDDVMKVGDVVLNHHIKRVPVMEGGQLVGVISRFDLLKLLLV